ncbi:pneumococcal-type histidine triad protein [Streptococcus catagoni]|uniref:pneumococcal-type histidine triad protein n=1 Tax=Streptococcus catagoni TaxID=2654874 RepID=UPI0039A70541
MAGIDRPTDDGYVFNPKDIVASDASGYVVRHGDHYHYILKAGYETVANRGQSVLWTSATHSNQGYAPNPLIGLARSTNNRQILHKRPSNFLEFTLKQMMDSYLMEGTL